MDVERALTVGDLPVENMLFGPGGTQRATEHHQA